MTTELDTPAVRWIKKWPNYCKHCGGWGLFSFVEMHGFNHGPGETFTEPCEALDELACHRCGEKAMPESTEGPCANCGWEYDDGIPECW